MQSLRGCSEIYIITCSVTNKKYVGQCRCFNKNNGIYFGTNGRFKSHIYSANHNNGGTSALHCAMNKYGVHNFSVKTIKICPKRQADYFEAKYIRQYNSLSPNGYNIKAGGTTSRWSDEARKRLAEKFMGEKNVRYGVKLSDEVKAKIGKGNTGKVRSEEVKHCMSEERKFLKPENEGLPKYIYHYKEKQKGGIEGYKVFKHPGIENKSRRILFVAKTQTMEDKLRQAIDCVRCLNIEYQLKQELLKQTKEKVQRVNGNRP